MVKLALSKDTGRDSAGVYSVGQNYGGNAEKRLKYLCKIEHIATEPSA